MTERNDSRVRDSEVKLNQEILHNDVQDVHLSKSYSCCDLKEESSEVVIWTWHENMSEHVLVKISTRPYTKLKLKVEKPKVLISRLD